MSDPFFFLSSAWRVGLLIRVKKKKTRQSTENVRCDALRHRGPECRLPAPGGTSSRFRLQVLPAPFHQGKLDGYRSIALEELYKFGF